MVNLLERIYFGVLLALVFLLPIFFLPITLDFFDFNKQALLVVGVAVLLVLWAARQVASRRFSFIATPLDAGVILVALAYIVSTTLQTPNKIDAFLYPGETTTILGATLLYFLILQGVKDIKSRLDLLVLALVGSGVVVAGVVALSALGVAGGISALPAFMKTKAFSPLGIPLATLMYLTFMAILCGGLVIKSFSSRLKKDKTMGAVLSVCFLIMVLATVLTVKNLFVGTQQIRLLPLPTGWAIGVETLKNSPFGVGPGNFLTAFNQNRPISYNGTDFWNFRFSSSSNFYLQALTEVGIVGLIALLFLVFQVFHLSGHRISSVDWSEISNNAQTAVRGLKINTLLFSVLVLMLLAFLVTPAPFVMVILFYILLALFVLSRESRRPFMTIEGSRLISMLALVFIALTLVGVGINGYKGYAAEVSFKKALEAGAGNDGKALYEHLIAAIKMSPRVDRYHAFLSQANVALIGLAVQKEEITDDDRAAITKTAQQAIQEAKVAVALNNKLSNNWENLARIYRSLMPIAKGSEQWATVAYAQAIALEPTNPNLRINLGGIWYGMGNYDKAAESFQMAVAAKRDLANAHFNLSAALREKKDIEGAIREMEAVLAIVGKDSKDFEIAKQELENLKSKLPAKPGSEGAIGESIEAPRPTKAPIIAPPIDLPADVASPPSPAPSASPVGNN